jgi:hypothetical protein
MYEHFDISGQVAVLIPIESREFEGSFVFWVQLCVFWDCTELQEEKPIQSCKMVFCEVCNLYYFFTQEDIQNPIKYKKVTFTFVPVDAIRACMGSRGIAPLILKPQVTLLLRNNPLPTE